MRVRVFVCVRARVCVCVDVRACVCMCVCGCVWEGAMRVESAKVDALGILLAISLLSQRLTATSIALVPTIHR